VLEYHKLSEIIRVLTLSLPATRETVTATILSEIIDLRIYKEILLENRG
jgi:hypothetical protein